MSRKVRGHTAKTRQNYQENDGVKGKLSVSQRPKTSLGFDRDRPEILHFLDNKPQRPLQAPKDEKEGLLHRSPRTPRKVAPQSKTLAKFTKREEQWRSIRDAPGGDGPLRRSNLPSTRNDGDQQRPSSKSAPNKPLKAKRTQETGTSNSLGARRKGPRGTSGLSSRKISKSLSDSENKSVPDKEQAPGKGLRLSISSPPTQRPARDAILSIEPLESIIESEDIQRYIEAQVSDHIIPPVSSMLHDTVEDTIVDDADENYDTDLESDFPAPPPKEYDPSEKRTYVDICLSRGLVPVSYVVKRLGEKSLVMRHHGLGPDGTKPLASALLSNTFIEELDLTDNDIREQGAIYLSLSLYDNLYITDLNLSDNFLKVTGGISLAKVLLKNTSLKKVILRGNHFNDKVAKVFAEALKENRSLVHLDLSYNEFGETGGLFLGAGLGLNYGLQTLDLSWNSIRNKGAVSMAASLRTNESLKSLNLSWNGLAFVGALALARHLKKNDTLEELDISNNRIGTKGVQRISLALKVQTSLRCFKIGLNPIGEDGVRALMNSVKQNMSIKYLGLEDITVSRKIHEEIHRLESERDIVIRTGGQIGHTQKLPRPSGMEILVQFIQDNRMRMKELFFQFDKDHSGDISRDEFKTGLKECGIKMDEKQLDTLIESIDIDNSNTIEYSEILYGREVVLSERRSQRKVEIRTEERERQSIQLPKLRGFED